MFKIKNSFEANIFKRITKHITILKRNESYLH